MTQRLINTGQADKGNGDPIRTAFTKVNDNFAELYNQLAASVVAGATAPTSPGEGDLWWDSASGRMYVYYGTAWVDASPVDGAGISSTDRLVNGNAELVLENDGTITSVTFPTRGTGKIGISGSEISTTPAGEGNYSAPLVLSSFSNDVWISPNGIGPRPKWEFKPDGTLNVPVPQGGLFTLTLSSANFIPRVGKTTLTLSGAPWVLEGQIQRNPDGSAELQLNQIFPKISNPGYVSGDTFTFDDQVHHLFGFNLEIGLADVVQAGPAGWTANLQANQLPQYPSTINSDGIIKLTSNENSWTFSTDGRTTFPFNMLATDSQLIVQSDGETEIRNLSETNGIDIVTNITNGDTRWSFGIDGSLSFPDSTVQSTAWTGITGFGEGFSLTDTDKIVTNKLYSTNLTQPTQHYRLELDTNGVVVLPDGSIINGSTIRGVAGTGELNYTGITIGPDSSHREESWMYVDHTGSYIATQYNTNQKLWQFKNDGSTTLPSGAGFVKGDNGQLKTNDGTTLSLDFRDTSGRGFYTNGDGFSLRGNGSNTWTFGADGKLTLPGAIVKSTVAKTGVVLPTTTGAVNNVSFSPFDGSGGLTDAIYGPFLLGETSLSVIVQSGLPVVLQLQTQPILTVGDVIGTIDSGDLGGTPGTTFTASVYSVTQATPTALDLTKSINKLTNGAYTLANGVEGQIMYLVRQTGSTYNSIMVNVANARVNGGLETTIDYYPFDNGTPLNMSTLIFTDGAWQADIGSWD